MPVYEFQAYSNEGKSSRGMIEAASLKEAKGKLREQGLMISQIGVPTRKRSKGDLSGDALVAFTLQLSDLLNAGLPLYESLSSLEEQHRGDHIHRIILNLCEQIKGGSPLSQAMAAFPESFDRLYCSMVAAGEAAGALDMVLARLGGFLDKQMKLQKQVVTSLLYPAILLCFAILVVGLLMGFVVPSMEGIFAGRELNGFTTFVIGASHFFRDYWLYYIPGTALAIGLAVWKLRSPAGQQFLERLGLRLPVIRSLMVQAAIARLARTMATLQKGGLTLIDSLRLARGVMQNETLEAIVEQAEQQVIEGSSLSKELSKSKLIPPLVWRMLRVGEEAGNTEGIWNRIADMYESELDKTLSRVMTLAQPVILLLMGVGIGAVMLAVLLPMSDIASLG